MSSVNESGSAFSDAVSQPAHRGGGAGPIRRLLVANRGEIARRVFRTAHAMGIDTVAVYADGDAAAPFVAEAGQAVALIGRTSAETYLDVTKVLHAAAITGADAVHPGYGFLAENAAFARAVVDAGLTWVGPPPGAIEAMGDKLAAKRLMAEAAVPMLPSVEVDTSTDLAAAAAEIGYPVLIKASAGGGGKGMRVVESADRLAAAVEGAQREAASSFGDGTVFIEKYLTAPRHVEIQVLGDMHGEVVHLFERECSIQRRHQKVIEEAPSPVLSAELRAAMGAAAVAAAQAVDYHSAGTVEFLVDGAVGGDGVVGGDGADAEFYFLEMNTRIQVEHPVTEEVTGIDLVREQLRVAQGEALGYGQADLAITGHSIEARLYAEDPANDFLPAIGTLHGWAAAAGLNVRLDSGVEQGSVVGVEFDPMLAKVVVHAPTRAEAAGRLALALERMTVAGVVTNRDFLVATLRTPEFLAGDTTTDFIERVAPAVVFEPNDEQLAMALVAAAMWARAEARSQAGAMAFVEGTWRNSALPPERRTFSVGEREVVVDYTRTRAGRLDVTVAADEGDGHTMSVAVVDVADQAIVIEADGRRVSFGVVHADGWWQVQGPDGAIEFASVARFPDHSAVDIAGGQVAPMPGKVLAVHVGVGDQVDAGQALVVMEAMKMEHTITAPGPATVVELRCAVDDQVDNGQVLVVLEERDDAAEAPAGTD